MDVRFGFSSTRANAWFWVHQNGIDHAVDEEGLPIRLAANIKATIHEEFRKGTDGLARRDFHFIRRGRDNVMSLSAVDKQGWLREFNLLETLGLLLLPPINNSNN
jgi:hypothetical protein